MIPLSPLRKRYQARWRLCTCIWNRYYHTVLLYQVLGLFCAKVHPPAASVVRSSMREKMRQVVAENPLLQHDLTEARLYALKEILSPLGVPVNVCADAMVEFIRGEHLSMRSTALFESSVVDGFSAKHTGSIHIRGRGACFRMAQIVLDSSRSPHKRQCGSATPHRVIVHTCIPTKHTCEILFFLCVQCRCRGEKALAHPVHGNR
jgi:hypothetical protein